PPCTTLFRPPTPTPTPTSTRTCAFSSSTRSSTAASSRANWCCTSSARSTSSAPPPRLRPPRRPAGAFKPQESQRELPELTPQHRLRHTRPESGAVVDHVAAVELVAPHLAAPGGRLLRRPPLLQRLLRAERFALLQARA